MKYLIPICECGGQLILAKGRSIEYGYIINKNGRVRSRPSDRHTVEMNEDFNVLKCVDCDTRYEYDTDNHGRVLRCDKY